MDIREELDKKEGSVVGKGSRMGSWDEEPSLFVSKEDWRYWRFDCNLEANLLKIRYGG
jgi:hypothetical protein